MAKNRDNMEADRLRSYSSAFSRSVFSNILSYSDFSPLDWLYGESVDKFQEGCSYLDFLSYIYKTLTSSYRCEYVYKNEIINQLLLKKYGTKNTIAFNEFKVGDSIVDIAMMNGESKAFEIKTKLDTPRRLKKQMSDYRKIFNKCYIVVDISECEFYANHLDEATGIVALSYKRGNIRLDEYRPAKRIEGIDSDVMMKCLRTCEYENIVREYFGELPDVPTYNLFEACKDQISHIDSAILNCLFLQEIKKRKSPTGYLKDSPKILRQIILSLNLTPKNQETLISKLNNPIRCQRDRSVASAYQTALKKKDDIAISLALSPFARKTAELVKSGAYEAAAGSCYAIFRCLAKTCKEHEDWFCGFTGYGDTYTKLAIFTEAVVELYCHLRQKTDLSKRMADEMDINLEVFNLETDFFGDLHCSSRFTDMLCDAQAQYGDYSELEKCPMWGMWERKGENEIKTLREIVGVVAKR